MHLSSATNVLRQMTRLFGRRVDVYLIWSFLVGILWFGIESSFVFILQGFLVSIGITPRASTMLPAWYPDSAVSSMIIFSVFGLVRAAIWYWKYYLAGLASDAFVNEQKRKVFAFAVSGRSDITTAEVMTAFNDYIEVSGIGLQQLALLLNNISAGLLLAVFGLMLAPVEMVVSVALLFVVIGPLKKIDRVISRLSTGANEKKTALNHLLVNNLKNGLLIKIYGREAVELERATQVLKDYEKVHMRFFSLTAMRSASSLVVGGFVVAILLYISETYLKTSGAALISFFYLFVRLTQNISEAQLVTNGLRMNWPGMQKLISIAVKLDIAEKEIAAGKKGDAHIGPLEARELGFAYNEREIFSRLNFKVDPGQVLLISGPSGAGKSTLLRLVMGIERPLRGSVQIGGANVTDIRSWLADAVGYVGPDPFLIPGTVRENLFYGIQPGRSGASDMEIWSILEQVKMREAIEHFDHGLDEPLREDTQLSTGQKQRIAIARALLRRPQILLFDEATANLDKEAEGAIIRILESIKPGLITCIVSHKGGFEHLADVRVRL